MVSPLKCATMCTVTVPLARPKTLGVAALRRSPHCLAHPLAIVTGTVVWPGNAIVHPLPSAVMVSSIRGDYDTILGPTMVLASQTLRTRMS